jgi:hypothetical protein
MARAAMLHMLHLGRRKRATPIGKSSFFEAIDERGLVYPGLPMNVIHSSVRGLQRLKHLTTAPESSSEEIFREQMAQKLRLDKTNRGCWISPPC